MTGEENPHETWRTHLARVEQNERDASIECQLHAQDFVDYNI